ncbi:MAG TPA: hypothetical protein P5567_02090 [Kiritimatiellia bacterium]|nr:hypothetical protein [Kiritimatiellia bacterium]HRZ11224.1 hypothetical protein [Kiritimatiellia bacterium]HSA19075.1 hypothetical protein [Kiritimatiellia bacterium]
MNLRLPSTLALLLLAASAGAAPLSFEAPEEPFVLDEEQALTNELWLVAPAADIRGAVQDDLFAVGGTLLVAGAMGRDVWALGNEVDLTGRAAGHARLLGRALDIRGSVAGNLIGLGGSVGLAADSEVGGDAVLVGEDVTVEGRIGGRAQIYAQRATLSGRFGGTVRLYANDIVVHPGTEIRGDLEYTSSRDLILDERVALTGQLIRKEAAAPALRSTPASWSEALSIQLLLFSAALLVALPFLAVFPGYAGRAVRLLRQSGWKCALAGVAAFALFPMAALILPLTIVGIPLAVVLLLLFILLLYASKFILALAVGGWLLRRRGALSFGRAISTLAVGLALLYGLVNVPGMGLAIGLIILWLGLGSLVLAALAPPSDGAAEPPPLPEPAGGPPPVPPFPGSKQP